MNPIMFMKSSLLLTIVITLVIVASITLATPPTSPESIQKTSSSLLKSSASSTLIESSIKDDSLKTVEVSPSSAKAPVESIEDKKISSNMLSGSSADSSPRQSRAVDSSTDSSALNRADSSPSQKSTTSSKKALDSHSESAPTSTPTTGSSSTLTESKSSGNKSTSSKAATPKSSSSKSASSSSSKSGADPSHYISKHDSYSAIAERHLFADAMRKSDKRRLQSTSMEHSSKLGDMFSSLKDVTNNGFSRSIGASVRSILKSKFSVPAYVASALLGAVALLAFYESPISPLPVPSLPEPPIGRFPPEIPSLPPNTQIPYKYRYDNNQQQQQYNAYQRAFQQQQPVAGGKAPIFNGSPQPYQTNDRVSFPGQTNNNNQQVPQLPDVAQRKSSQEYEAVVSSRSFLGGGGGSGKTGSANALNSRIGAAGAGQQQSNNGQLDYPGGSFDNMMNGGMNSASQQFANGGESKLTSASISSNGGLSNSHLINKLKSYFSRSSPASSAQGNQMKSPNPYEQYQRMSLMQALFKDTSFLPAFLTGGGSKSNLSPTAGSFLTAFNGSNKSKGQLTERMITTPNNNQNGAQFSYGTDSLMQSPSSSKQQAQSASSSSGIMKAADKLAHALLETLTTGLQRQSASSSSAVSPTVGTKSSNSQQDQMNSRKSPSSDSDLLPLETLSSAYTVSGSSFNNQSKTSPESSASSFQSDNVGVDHSQPVSSSRSGDDDIQIVKQPQSQTESKQTNGSASSSSSLSSSLTRKTRSIEEPVKSQKPSTAANINHVIDYVSDSYAQNRLLFSTILNQVGLGHATHYMDSLLIGGSNVR